MLIYNINDKQQPFLTTCRYTTSHDTTHHMLQHKSLSEWPEHLYMLNGGVGRDLLKGVWIKGHNACVHAVPTYLANLAYTGVRATPKGFLLCHVVL